MPGLKEILIYATAQACKRNNETMLGYGYTCRYWGIEKHVLLITDHSIKKYTEALNLMFSCESPLPKKRKVFLVYFRNFWEKYAKMLYQ